MYDSWFDCTFKIAILHGHVVVAKHGQWVHLLRRGRWLVLIKLCQKRWHHLAIGRNILEIVLVPRLVTHLRIIPRKQLPVIIEQPEVIINGRPVGIIIDLTIKLWWIHFLPIYHWRKPRDIRFISGSLPVSFLFPITLYRLGRYLFSLCVIQTESKGVHGGHPKCTIWFGRVQKRTIKSATRNFTNPFVCTRNHPLRIINLEVDSDWSTPLNTSLSSANNQSCGVSIFGTRIICFPGTWLAHFFFMSHSITTTLKWVLYPLQLNTLHCHKVNLSQSLSQTR